MEHRDDPFGWLTASKPQPATPEAQMEMLHALPSEDLARIWSASRRVGLKQQTPQWRQADAFFSSVLPQEDPQRALEVVTAVLRGGDTRLSMELPGLLGGVLLSHGKKVWSWYELLDAEAQTQVRWLLAAIYDQVADDLELRGKLRKIADHRRWQADAERMMRPSNPVDPAALSLPELARHWVAQRSLADVEIDGNYQALGDFLVRTREVDPDKTLDFVVAVLKIESNDDLLDRLAHFQIGGVLGAETIDRIEREAQADERFAQLLSRVDTSAQPDAIRMRVDALTASFDDYARARQAMRSFDAMPLDELAALWREVQYISQRERLDFEQRFSRRRLAKDYCDDLPHHDPERAFDLVMTLLRSEALPAELKIQLTRPMGTIIHHHGRRFAARLEAAAKTDPRVRWLVAGSLSTSEDDDLVARLEKIADREAWAAAWERGRPQARLIDFKSLSLPELACAWLVEKDKPALMLALDANKEELEAFEDALLAEPDRTVALIVELLRIEKSEVMRGEIAQLLANLLGNNEDSREAIEREARENEDFASLLTYFDPSDWPEETEEWLLTMMPQSAQS